MRIIKLEELSTMTYADFKDSGAPLASRQEEIFCNYDYLNPPYYHCTPEYNLAVGGSNQYFYHTIETGGNLISFIAKVAMFMGHRCVKVIDKPFTYENVRSLETAVLKELYANPNVTFLYKEKYEDFYKELGVKGKWKSADCDFYYDREEMREFYSSNKWMTRKQIRRFLKEPFRVEVTAAAPSQFMKLREKWETEKQKQESITGRPNLKRFVKYKDSHLKYLSIYWNNQLIISLALLDYDDYIIACYKPSISRCEVDPALKSSIHYLDDVLYYMVFKEFVSCKRIYLGGANPAHAKLASDHKQNHSNGFIKYYHIDKRKEK